jgi:hypothetical protein
MAALEDAIKARWRFIAWLLRQQTNYHNTRRSVSKKGSLTAQREGVRRGTRRTGAVPAPTAATESSQVTLNL